MSVDNPDHKALHFLIVKAPFRMQVFQFPATPEAVSRHQFSETFSHNFVALYFIPRSALHNDCARGDCSY
jgi:hypothetical protein